MTHRNPLLGILAAVVPLCACSSGSGAPSACSGTTTTMTVSVVDDTNEPIPVCNATVVATGPSTVTLTPQGGTNSCSYFGTVKAGMYTVTATATGYQPGTIHDDVQAGCPVSLSINVIATM